MTTEDSKHLDDLADRLIEKQQRFVYFFITANTGVIIYSTNFFIEIDIKTLVSNIIFWPLIIGCVSLLVSTVSCIVWLFLKNKSYESYLDYLRDHTYTILREKKEEEFKSPYKKPISKTMGTMFISFGLGMGLNISVYVYHFWQVHKQKIEPPKKEQQIK